MCILIGLLYSSALQSIGVLFIVLDALWRFKLEKDSKAAGLVAAMCGIFLLYFLGSWTLQDVDFMLLKWRIKLPFLLLPLGFFFAPALKAKQYFSLLSFFVVLVFVASSISAVQYALDFAAINEAYYQAKVMPTPVNHIRFSLMNAFAVCAGHYLFTRNHVNFHRLEPWLYLAISVLLFAYLHLLAVRSGLLAIYLCLLYLAGRKLFLARKVKQTLAILGLVILIPLSAYLLVPSFQQKLNYSNAYLSALVTGKDVNQQHSDIGRFRSIQMGLDLAKEHPVFGVGMGNLQQEVDRYYFNRYPAVAPQLRLMPHNQFVYILAGLGMVGLIIFSICILTPVMINFLFWSDPLLSCLNIALLSSFLIESPLETHLGVSFYLVFTLMAMSYFRKKETDTSVAA